MTEFTVQITLTELCQNTDTQMETIIACVEHGILEPAGSSEAEWLFDADMVQIVRRALRLRDDLGINWEGIALALDLIEQREVLASENKWLRSRLQRFLIDD